MLRQIVLYCMVLQNLAETCRTLVNLVEPNEILQKFVRACVRGNSCHSIVCLCSVQMVNICNKLLACQDNIYWQHCSKFEKVAAAAWSY